jgi:hypothetical protein
MEACTWFADSGRRDPPSGEIARPFLAFGQGKAISYL